MGVRRELTRVGMHSFVSVSRRLHAPLALVSNPMSRILSRRPLASQAQRRLRLIRGGVGHVLLLVGRMLSFEGVRGGGVNLAVRCQSVVVVLRGVVSGFQLLTARGGVGFSLRAALPSIFL